MAVLAGTLTLEREDCAPVAGKSTLNRLLVDPHDGLDKAQRRAVIVASLDQDVRVLGKAGAAEAGAGVQELRPGPVIEADAADPDKAIAPPVGAGYRAGACSDVRSNMKRVIGYLGGGVGNQLFTYAAAWAFAQRERLEIAAPEPRHFLALS
jgi:hypothetical protein